MNLLKLQKTLQLLVPPQSSSIIHSKDLDNRLCLDNFISLPYPYTENHADSETKANIILLLDYVEQGFRDMLSHCTKLQQDCTKMYLGIDQEQLSFAEIAKNLSHSYKTVYVTHSFTVKKYLKSEKQKELNSDAFDFTITTPTADFFEELEDQNPNQFDLFELLERDEHIHRFIHSQHHRKIPLLIYGFLGDEVNTATAAKKLNLSPQTTSNRLAKILVEARVNQYLIQYKPTEIPVSLKRDHTPSEPQLTVDTENISFEKTPRFGKEELDKLADLLAGINRDSEK